MSTINATAAVMFKRVVMSSLKNHLNTDIKNNPNFSHLKNKGELERIFYHLSYDDKAFQRVDMEKEKGEILKLTSQEVDKIIKMIPAKVDKNEFEYVNAELLFNVKGYKINLQIKYKNVEEIKIVTI